MRGISRYAKLILFLCVSSIIFCAIFGTLPSILRRVNKVIVKQMKHRQQIKEELLRNEQIETTSVLGKWLLSPEGSLTPPIINKKREPYLILIWKHGMFLEHVHMTRTRPPKGKLTTSEYVALEAIQFLSEIFFVTNNNNNMVITNETISNETARAILAEQVVIFLFSPWENCTVKCVLSYQSKDLNIADAVVFHLHLTRNVLELPIRRRWNQRWIFLTDESPINTFMYGNQQLSKYDGLFNWSMTYRMNSDVPVPYGRTISTSFINSPNINFSKDLIQKSKTKLVTVMGSNCEGTNDRWKYINELKVILGNDLDIYGKCLNANTTACPGHFDKDCSVLNSYKFYLAFENSNCREYLTEKVFWHGYHKLAIPIIMGAPKKDCEKLLPPHSFLHVSDFVNPRALADYIRYLNKYDDKYFEFHEWRKYYKVINEHGYFGSMSRHYCRICEALHYNSPAPKVYEDMKLFWNKKRDCTL